MNNITSILILIFLAITFLQSGYDKLFYWKDNVEWLKGHFAKTPLKNHVPLALLNILILELISGILCVVGCIELFVNNGRIFGFYGAVFSCITLLMLLFGQRLAKDYDGARTIVIYFIPAILAVYWLN
ncbi:DoxX family membrane protein [Flavobacterium sp. GSP27]|uniref:DoxX family membrane protein n=1 Tax=Flavobacterium bomense TaxID=2497483 RepID=A0A432CRU5_9FLAO|nr:MULTISPECIES: DoxX family membrane protein [Flavobacterium]RTY96387.1 DoxX family membrane protein [Flavobacterium sp. GSN2]RTY70397.1 DoxX family membrane protein [Flavobacterium sp. LB2P53]RTY76311.1 DoxX family membrane protein [Flavobacterium sp. LS1R10]RTY81304.1 DoxX family membrane protein [Flavobacterium sp. ZB4P23]RTY85206.1 DoxX family membrane protein [Flavobacterium sp. LS1P28]